MGHTRDPGGRHTFADGEIITKDQLDLFARASEGWTLSYKVRKELGEPVYKLFQRAKKRTKSGTE